MPTIVAAAHARTLGDALRCRRVEARAQRVERVVAALEERVRICAASGSVPQTLTVSVQHFRAELTELRTRGGTAGS